MKKVFGACLEMIRIIFILLIVGGLLGGFVKLIYASFGINVDDTTGAW